MTTLMTEHENDLYLAAFAEMQKNGGASEPDWLRSLRRASIASYRERGFPTTREEAWRYTRVTAIAETPFEPAGAAEVSQADVRALAPLGWNTIEQLDGPLMVFVNGRLAPELSRLDRLPEGLSLTSIACELDRRPAALQETFERLGRRQDHAFLSLNHAFARDGAVLRVAAGCKAAGTPVQVLFLTTAPEGPGMAYPRLLVDLAEGASATLLENHLGPQDQVYLSCGLTDLRLADGSSLDYYKLQQESTRAFHIHSLVSRLEGGAELRANSFALGARLARNEVESLLDGDLADCRLHGLYLAREDQHVDNFTLLDHAAPNCPSLELYKGILDGSAHATFRGRILVRRGSDKTDSVQHNCNLLRSDQAQASSKPQLEIYADDVKCTHGATVGEVDEQALLYLETRGIPFRQAHDILTFAFARELVDQVRLPGLANRIESEIYRWLDENRALYPERAGREGPRGA